MSFDEIPENQVESYPCDCGGNVVKEGIHWECDTCGLIFVRKGDEDE